MPQAPQVRIVNTRATFLTTPAIGTPRDPETRRRKGPPKFSAKRLQPGGNNIRQDHLEALNALDPDRGPGKVWAQWRTLGYVKFLSPEESASQLHRPEGPEAPHDLRERKVEAAEAMVMVETDLEVLARWYASDKRKAVREAINVRRAQLEGDDSPGSEG